jgi:hypothetical protein
MSNLDTVPVEVACTASQLTALEVCRAIEGLLRACPHLPYRPPDCGHAHCPIEQVAKEHG